MNFATLPPNSWLAGGACPSQESGSVIVVIDAAVGQNDAAGRQIVLQARFSQHPAQGRKLVGRDQRLGRPGHHAPDDLHFLHAYLLL